MGVKNDVVMNFNLFYSLSSCVICTPSTGVFWSANAELGVSFSLARSLDSRKEGDDNGMGEEGEKEIMDL